jgi:hypothetical protein
MCNRQLTLNQRILQTPALKAATIFLVFAKITFAKIKSTNQNFYTIAVYK